jgi:hypothetical protein
MPELTRRYIVMQMATEGPFDVRDPDATFVLKPWKDPAALRALEAYRDHCYPELAVELTSWIETVHAGPVVRGGVGARNEEHMSRVRSDGTRGPARRPGRRAGARPGTRRAGPRRPARVRSKTSPTGRKRRGSRRS